MNKKLRIIIDILLILVGIVLLVFGIKDVYNTFKVEEVPDALIFRKSYNSVSEDNSYKYITLKEADELLRDGTGIILIGSPSDAWMQVLVSPLDDIAKSYELDIYYLELDKLDTNSTIYEEFEIDLSKINTPSILLIKEGTILKEMSKDDIFESNFEGAPIEYFDEENLIKFKNSLKEISNLK